MMFQPAYFRLPLGELQKRAELAYACLEKCELCPRACGSNRLANER